MSSIKVAPVNLNSTLADKLLQVNGVKAVFR
jgi:hypothetical protein